MLDEAFRQWLSRGAAGPARALLRLGVSPDQVTLAAFGIAVGGAGAIATGHFRAGLALWLVSRLLDGYDGLLARLGGRTSLFGGYLDICLDMLAYSLMAIAFARAMPADAILWLVVLAGYVMAITTTLALSSLLEKLDRQLGGNRSVQFTPGLAEGGETTIVYSVIAMWPSWSRWVLVVWIVLLSLTMVQRTGLAWRLLRARSER